MSDGGRAAARFAAAALGALFAALATLYGWQAWRHGTPTIFTDELELTQLSRSIASTGHAARRGDPHSFNSLVTFLWAPAWRIGSTKDAYEVVKLLDTLVMTSVVFPTYFLARTVASRAAAIFAAAGAAVVPALSYSPMLLEEPLAYPWAALSLLLTTKAILTRSRRWVAAAVLVALAAPLVRGELALLPAVLLLAAALFAVTGRRARGVVRTWQRWDWAGAAMLGLGGLVVVNAALSHSSASWEIPTRLYKGRIFDLGLQAGTIFTIGVGVLPVVAALAVGFSLREAASSERRAFGCVFWAGLMSFATYTAVKSAYLSTVFATRVEERNLFYVAPLVFAAAAVWLDRPRVRWAPALGALALVAPLLARREYELLYPYFEAPGNGILAFANRELEWSQGYLRVAMLWVLAVCALVVLAPAAVRALRGTVSETWTWAGRGMQAALAVLVVAWGLTGEIYSAKGFREGGDRFLANLAQPVDWVDRATNGDPTTYFGQQIVDQDGVYLTEFWNRSIRNVWSLDGSAPGPGRTQTPDLVRRDGTLWPSPGTPYALADRGVVLAGHPIAQRKALRVYRLAGPLRLAESTQAVDADGWMGEHASWSRYAGRAGTVVVTLSREGFCAKAPQGHAVVRVGELVVSPTRHSGLGRVRASARALVQSCKRVAVRLPSGPPPFQVDVRVTPAVRLSDYGFSDSRLVTAVVGFELEGARKAATSSVNR